MKKLIVAVVAWALFLATVFAAAMPVRAGGDWCDVGPNRPPLNEPPRDNYDYRMGKRSPGGVA